jgi:hypothetical protein
MCPHRPPTWAGSSAGSPVYLLLCVSETVISGPHRLRTARRRAEAMNLVQCKKNLHAESVISGPHRLSTARRRDEAMNLVQVEKTYMQRPSYPDPIA